MRDEPAPIPLEDRLRIHAAVLAEFGNTDIAEIVCELAVTAGLKRALLMFNDALAEQGLGGDRQPS